jgi:hypothetical protein
MIRLVLTTFLAVTLFLTGCATPQVSLTKQVQAKLGPVEEILIVPQNNLNIVIQRTNLAAGGLIGALIGAAIDSSRQSTAEKEAEPIIEALKDYDFRKVMLEASADAMKKIDKVKLDAVRLEKVPSDSAIRIAFDQSSASAVLFCNVGYALSSGNIVVNAIAEIYPKNTDLKQFRNKPDETNPLGSGNFIYRKIFSFSKQAVDKDNIKASLSEAAASIAGQIAADVNHGI